jgi:hypothetical protein
VAFAITDGELDFAGMIGRVDEPLTGGRDDVLGREGRRCEETCEEEDGDAHRNPKESI